MESRDQSDQDGADQRAAVLTFAQGALKELREQVEQIAQDRSSALWECGRICSELAQGFQEAGLSHLAAFSKDLGGAVAALGNDEDNTKDVQVLIFFLNDTLNGFESFCREASDAGADSASMRDQRNYLLEMLGFSASASVPVSGKAPEAAPAPVPQQAANQNQSPVPVATVSTTKSFLLCSNDDRHIALPVESVVEVVQKETISACPFPKPSLVGLMTLRGDVIPIVEMKSVIGLEESARLVVVCQSRNARFGFLVGQAQRVVDLDASSFQTVQTIMPGSDEKVIEGFCDYQEKSYLIMNLDRVAGGVN